MTNDHRDVDTNSSEADADRYRVTDRDVYLLVTLEVAVMLLWTFWQLLDVDLEVRNAPGTTTVSLTAIVLTTTLVAVASYGLLRLLRRRGGLRVWTGVAWTVLLVSCAGPLMASSLPAGVALLTFHLLVGVGLIEGVRNLHGAKR